MMKDDIHRESLLAMFALNATVAKANTDPVLWEGGKDVSLWVEYEGPDCSPFKAFLRFKKDTIVLAQLLGTGNRNAEKVVRKGRMPIIIAAASQVCQHLIIESVLNNDLKIHLERTGWTNVPNDSFSYEKTFEVA